MRVFVSRRILSLTVLAILVAAGCSGSRKGEDLPPLAPRSANVEVVLLSFGALQGELLECG